VAMLEIGAIHCFLGVLLQVPSLCFAYIWVLLAPNYRWLDPQQPFQKGAFLNGCTCAKNERFMTTNAHKNRSDGGDSGKS
jgi:hypothetical protein